MPWVIYDPKDKDYLCVEQGDADGELWDTDRAKATRYLTEEEAQWAFDEIDVEEWLTHIGPLYIEDDPPPPKKRWEDMTFAERMAQVDEDFENTVASRVHQKMMAVKLETETVTGRTTSSQPSIQNIPLRPGARQLYDQIREMVKDKNIKVVSRIHDEVIVEVDDKRPGPVDEERTSYTDLIWSLVAGQELPPPKPIDYGALEMRVMKNRTFDSPMFDLVSEWKKEPHGRQQEEGRIGGVHGDGGSPRSELPDGESDPSSR